MSASLEHPWRRQGVWSQVADRLKADLRRKRMGALAAGIAGAVFSTAAAALGLDYGFGRFLAFLSAFCLGLAALLHTLIDARAVRNWTRARSVAEALKAEVYLSLAGFGAVDFDTKIEEIERDAEDLREYTAGINPRSRPLPPVHDVASYLAVRVEGQIDKYYRPRAAEMQTKARLFRTIEITFALLGLLFGAAAGTWELDAVAIWIPVTTTVSAAITAHAAAERYLFLLVEYLRTADELERIRDRRGSAAGLTDEQLVQRAEHIVSIQNEGWMAKLTQNSGR
jgi:conflict system pore-forming effector with SLATT domain/uncharacterized protein DUF4231